MALKKERPGVASSGTKMTNAASKSHHPNVLGLSSESKKAGGRDIRFAWQNSIRNSDLPKTSRAVLQTLSTYMGPEGNCYPSQATLAASTGMSKRTIVKHIGYAERAGWLKKVKVKSSRGTWGYNTYYAAIPRTLSKNVDAPNYQVNMVHEPDAPDGSHRVHEVHSNNPPNNHFNNGWENSIEEVFELVWENFPRNPNSSSKKALAEWRSLTAAEQEQCVTAAIEDGLQFKRCHGENRSTINDKLQYVPHLSTWLARRAWAR